MKLGDGVEQAIHSVLLLSGLPVDGVLPASALAEYHGVSSSYLLKHLQALASAGLLLSVPGPKGGYRLARAAAHISLLEHRPRHRRSRARLPLRRNPPTRPLSHRGTFPQSALRRERRHAARRKSLPRRARKSLDRRPARRSPLRPRCRDHEPRLRVPRRAPAHDAAASMSCPLERRPTPTYFAPCIGLADFALHPVTKSASAHKP